MVQGDKHYTFAVERSNILRENRSTILTIIRNIYFIYFFKFSLTSGRHNTVEYLPLRAVYPL